MANQKVPYRYLVLLLILACGGVLRFHALSYGLGHHPDERHMVFVTQRLSLEDLNPRSFAYGSFPYYLTWLTSQAIGYFNPFFKSYDGIFYTGRTLCAIFGLLGVFLTCLLAKRVFKHELVALASAALLALNFFHIQLSRYFTSDVILTTTCTLTLYGIVRYLEKEDTVACLLTGLGLGLSVATKISAILLLPLILLAGAIRIWQQSVTLQGNPKKSALWLVCVLLLAVLTAFIFEPYAILDYHTFRAHVWEQTSMVRGLWRPPYTIQYAGTWPFLYHLKQMFFYTLGWPVALAAAAGLVLAAISIFKEPQAQVIVLLTWILLFFLLTAGWQVKFPRYLLPIYPEILIYAAFALCTLPARLNASLSQT